MRTVLCGTAALAAVVCCSSAQAQLWVSGVVQYNANATGSSTTEPAEYDNILNTNNSPFEINGAARGTTFALSLGANNFTFTRPGGYNALSFYFGTTADPFARPFASMPDLVAYNFNGTVMTPAVGALVQTNGQFSGTLPWGGQSTFTSGDWIVAVTELNFATSENTFVLTVRQVPTPGAAAIMGLGGLMAAARRRR